MKISACCIIKNEEKNLPAWIDGVRDIADEIIVVDTGSTDNSLTLLNDLKNKYNLPLQSHFFKWVDDFSAAKNFAISKATGDWIIFTDADEYFAEEDRPKIRPMLLKLDPDKSVIGVDTPRVNIDVDKNNAPISEDEQIRIFRKQEDFLYIGAIHERLWYKGTDAKTVLKTEHKLIHTGYSAGVLGEKLARNDKIILENEKAFDSEGLRDYYVTGALISMNDYAAAEEHIKKAVKYMKEFDHFFLIKSFRAYIEIEERLNAPREKIEEILNDALKCAPNHPDLLIYKLPPLMEQGNYKEAEKIAKTIIKEAQDRQLRAKYLNVIDANLPYVHYALGAMYIAENRREEAKSELLTALKSYRYKKNVLCDLLSLYEGDEEGALKLVAEFYDEENDKDFLANVFEARPRDGLYMRFCKDKSTVDYRLSAGNIVQAITLAAEELELAKRQNLDAKKNKAALKSSLINLALCFLFLNLSDLPKVEKELNLLPPSVIAVILRFYGENLPPVEGEIASYNALLPKVEVLLPKGLMERFLGVRF